MSHRILSVSYDGGLLETREAILRAAGYNVTSAEGFQAAIEECHSGNFDLVIIGHSIPRRDKDAIIKAFREHCKAPVISLLRVMEQPLPGTMSITPDPATLLKAVASVLSNRNPDY